MADASRVVLGLGGCVDYELTLTADVLEQLVVDYGIGAAELTAPAPVADERDLVVSILGYLARGGGGEHFVASAPALGTFAGRFPHRATLGGTSVRAGILMSRLGVPSTLHLVSINDTVRNLLPPRTEYTVSSATDSFFPHLIVQYERGLRVRAGDLDLVAPFPNRLIYVNDPANGAMRLTADLGDRLATADVFLISGFNAMRTAGELDDRLAELRSHLRRLPPAAVTYFEDAAYHEPAFSGRVRDALLDEIDVYGLNEDEMQTYLGHPVDLLSAAAVAEALAAVHALIPVPTLVLHTKYWAVALGERAAEFAGALDTGIVMGRRPLRPRRRLHRRRRRPAPAAAPPSRVRRVSPRRCASGSATRSGASPPTCSTSTTPTTVGLGDTFVGGFLAAVTRLVTR